VGANYACGLRNSYGFDFHPGSGAIYLGDNGNENKNAGEFAWWDGLDRVPANGGVSFGYGFPAPTGACNNSVLGPLVDSGGVQLGGSNAATNATPAGTNYFATNSHAPAGALFYTGTRIPQLQNTLVVNGEYNTTIYNYDVDEYNATPGTVLSNAPVSTTTSGTGILIPTGASFLTDIVQGPNGCIYVSFLSDTGSKYFIYRLKDSGGTACQ